MTTTKEPKRVSSGVYRHLSSAVNALSMFGAMTVFALMIIFTIAVALRYLGYPFPGVVELTVLCMTIIAFACFPYTQAQRANIAIEILVNRLHSKGRFFVDLIVLVISLGFWIILFWQTGLHAWDAWVEGEVSMGLIRFPTWPAKTIVPLGCFFVALVVLAQIISHLNQGFSGRFKTGGR